LSTKAGSRHSQHGKARPPAEHLGNEIIAQARARQKTRQGNASSHHSRDRGNCKGLIETKAIEDFETAIDLAQKGRFTRLLADAIFIWKTFTAKERSSESGIFGKAGSRIDAE